MDEPGRVVDLDTIASEQGDTPPAPTRGGQSGGIDPPAPGAPDLGVFAWIWSLLFRPSRFFARYGSTEKPGLWLFVIVYLIGLSGVNEQYQLRVLNGQVSWLPPHWKATWVILGLLSFIALCSALVFRGWWFRFRLWLCGVKSVNAYWRSVRIWSQAGMIVAVPSLLLLVFETFWFDTPTDAVWTDLPGELWWSFGLLVLPFWAVLASYKGVRAVFPEARKWSTRFWFLIAPSVLLGLGLLALAIGSFLQGWQEPADLDEPQRYSSPSFSLKAPGNWRLMEDEGMVDPESLLAWQTPQGAQVSLMLVPGPLDETAFLEIRREELEQYGAVFESTEPLTRIGPSSGIGARSDYQDALLPWVHEQLLVAVSDHAVLEVEVIRPRSAEKETDDGLDFLLRSLTVTPADTRPVTLDDPLYYAGARWSLNIPAAWFLVEETETSLHLEGWRPVDWSIYAYTSDRTIREELIATIAGYLDDAEASVTQEFTEFAGLTGRGVVARGPTGDGEGDLEIRSFIHTLPSGELVEVTAAAFVDDLEAVSPAFGLLESTLELTPPPAPDTDG